MARRNNPTRRKMVNKCPIRFIRVEHSTGGRPADTVPKTHRLPRVEHGAAAVPPLPREPSEHLLRKRARPRLFASARPSLARIQTARTWKRLSAAVAWHGAGGT